MALRKEPQRRYVSVEQFAQDIRRHLEHLPVIARKDAPAHRASKFITRHKVSVAVGALVTVALLSATGITLRQARIARTERDRAERRFNDVRALANSLIFDIHDGISQLPGSTPIRELIVKKALLYLDDLSQEASGDPSVQRELANAYDRVGGLQWSTDFANQESAKATDPGEVTLLRTHVAGDYAETAESMMLTNHLSEASKVQ